MPISFSRSAAGTVVSLASLAALPAPAFGQTTQASLEQRYQDLASEERTRAGDPEYDYLLGMAAADSGHLGEALIALQRVLAKQPNYAQARAEYARVPADDQLHLCILQWRQSDSCDGEWSGVRRQHPMHRHHSRHYGRQRR